MTKWTFKVFRNYSGDDTFEQWILSQSAEAEEKIRGLIKRLSNADIRLWIRPYFSPLDGPLRELIIKTKDKQYRPIGCFGPGPQVFTLLIGATKESKKRKTIWNPSNAIETAKKRHKLVFEDKRYVGEYKPRERSTEEETEE